MRKDNDRDKASAHLDRAADHTGDAAEHMKEAAHHTKEALKAGASGTAERSAEAARSTAETARGVAAAAAGAVADAGRSAGRAAKQAAGGTAAAAGNAFSGVQGAVESGVGRVAAKVGGWWNSARTKVAGVPAAEEQVCRVHFESYDASSDELTYEVALTAYALGYVAGQNPDYSQRSFDDIEPDLRHGYASETQGSYDSWRDFTRIGFERGGSFP